jgi:peptide/nickel transport system permease protein
MMSESSLSSSPAPAPDRNMVQQIVHALRQATAPHCPAWSSSAIYVVCRLSRPGSHPMANTRSSRDIPFAPWSEATCWAPISWGAISCTRLIYGARNSIGIAFVTTLLAFAIGGFFGHHGPRSGAGSIR